MSADLGRPGAAPAGTAYPGEAPQAPAGTAYPGPVAEAAVAPGGATVATRAPMDVEEWDEWSATISHDCEPGEEVPAAPRTRRRGGRRLVGIDAARGVALIGMVAVHVFSAVGPDGGVSLPWRLSSGTSSALFAVLGGIGLAFMSGRTTPLPSPRGVTLARLLVRAVVIAVVGLLLGQVVPVDSAGVILPYLGVMFAMSLLFLPLRARPLLLLAAGWALLAPVVSHLLRQTLGAPEPVNLTFAHLLQAPGDVLVHLVLTGLYPALTWFAYILLGLGLGRLPLGGRWSAVTAVAVGLVLSVGAVAVAGLLRGPLGGLAGLAADEQGRLTLDQLTESLVWGGDGTAPATSWWWLTTVAPHTGAPLDLVRTAGVALVVLGLGLGVAALAPRALEVLAAPGSMTLTLYTGHLLLLLVPLSDRIGDLGAFLVHIALLTAFGVLWRRAVGKGPLEWLVWWLGTVIAPGRPGRHSARR